MLDTLISVSLSALLFGAASNLDSCTLGDWLDAGGLISLCFLLLFSGFGAPAYAVIDHRGLCLSVHLSVSVALPTDHSFE